MRRPLTPGQRRRLDAKRHNEHVKLSVTSLNAIGLALFGTAFVVPALSNVAVLLSPGPWILLSLALGLHFSAHGFLRFLRSEE